MHPDDEFVEDNRERSPTSDQDDTASPTPDGAQSQSDIDPDGDETFDVLPDITSEVLSAGPVAEDQAATEDVALPQSDAESPEPLADPSAPQDAAVPSEPAGEKSPSGIQQIDWSTWVPAPGYADPQTGEIRSVTGRVNQSGHDLFDLVDGRRPVFEPDSVESGADQGPEPPFFAPPFRDAAGPPFFGGNNDGSGASPQVSVDVRVSLTDEAIERDSKGSIRKAAEFSRAEILVVARRLLDIDDEIYAREQQRRVLARQY